VDDLIDKIRYYLAHDTERQRIAMNGYRRVMRDHRFRDRMRQAGQLIARGMVTKAERRSVISA
jgi:spore maturation protein CgeB